MTRPSLLTALVMTMALTLPTPPIGAQVPPGPNPFVGTWEGRLDTGAAKLRLVFHVQLGEDGALHGTMDSPDQGAAGIPASAVTIEGRTLVFALAPLSAEFRGTLSDDGATLNGTFTQGPGKLPLVLARGEATTAPSAPPRPQHPNPPFPYHVEEVQVASNAAGVRLAGTLTLPQGSGPFPGVVLVSGSGPQDRDESLAGHKPFLVLADHLTRQGIAVLRYDDRGVGASTGSFAEATSEDFAADALAAVGFLHARAEVGAVGIVGHSEGGLVGPLAASRSDAVEFVVMLAGPGLPGGEIVQLQGELIARAGGVPESVRATNLELQRRLFAQVLAEPDPALAAPKLRAILDESVAALSEESRKQMGEAATPAGLDGQVRQVNSPWFRFFLSHDPRPTLERVRVPVLALNGELDLQVPAEANLREIAAALARGGNRDVTTRMLPGLNHLFQRARSGAPSEYGQISETMNPAALEAVSAWVLERFARAR